MLQEPLQTMAVWHIAQMMTEVGGCNEFFVILAICLT
jgi:hypothetical protein